jgi:multiple sugar transport system substrate-binding protein
MKFLVKQTGGVFFRALFFRGPFLRTVFLLASGFLLLVSSACSGLVFPGIDGAATQTQPVQTPTTSPQISPSPSAAPDASQTPGTLTLRLWLPPEFDPAAGTPAGDILQARLDEFEARRPNVTVETRIKAVDGTGGIINTLTTASTAAPLALPDVVALPRLAIEPAVQKGLLYPFSDLGPLRDAQWFDYAAQLSGVEQGQYSLPFAGDALLLLYRPEEVETPPRSWDELLQGQAALLFPAASPLALFTLAQYNAAGGSNLDADGRPFLDQTVLTAVYIYYQQASAGEKMPFWLTQYEDDNQVWQAYQDQRAPMIATWSSRYLGDPPAGSAPSQLPTQDSEPFTLATGWVWATPNPDPTRRELSTELAVFLSESEFLGQWTQAAGYLPTRPDVLAFWSDPDLQQLASQLVESAFPYPPFDVLSILGPALQETTIEVLKQQNTPSGAAEKAAGQVNNP